MRNHVLIAAGYLLIAMGTFWTWSTFMFAFFDWAWWVPAGSTDFRVLVIIVVHVIGIGGGFIVGIDLVTDQYSRAPKR